MLWNIAGTIALSIGVLGIAVPLVPTTPFLLMAAACFAKGSPRMYKWMMTNRYFGSYLRDYREGRGIPLRVKIGSILFLWAVIGVSAVFAAQNAYIRIGLIAIAIAVSAHILSIRPQTSEAD